MARVRGERQREPVLALEIGVAAHAVGRDANHRRAGLGEARREAVEIERLGGAAGGVVLRVEEQHDELAAQIAEPEIAAGVGRQVEIRRKIADV